MSAAYLTKARLRALDAQLSGRDRHILSRVSVLRFVRGGQLARLCFADAPERTAREALLRLTRLGLLERLPRPVGGVRGGSAGYIYRLGPAGQRLIGQTWRTHVPGTLFLAHSLQIAELHTLLVEADRAGSIELIELAGEVGSRRRYGGRRMLRPDSYLRLGVGEYEDDYFIEVDMGTEGSRALTTKLRQYVEYQASGREQAEHGIFPKVLWTTPDEARAEVIRGCIGRLPTGSQAVFSVAPFERALCVLSGDTGNNDLPKPATDVTKLMQS
jgi:hypothetical protein